MAGLLAAVLDARFARHRWRGFHAYRVRSDRKVGRHPVVVFAWTGPGRHILLQSVPDSFPLTADTLAVWSCPASSGKDNDVRARRRRGNAGNFWLYRICFLLCLSGLLRIPRQAVKTKDRTREQERNFFTMSKRRSAVGAATLLAIARRLCAAPDAFSVWGGGAGRRVSASAFRRPGHGGRMDQKQRQSRFWRRARNLLRCERTA